MPAIHASVIPPARRIPYALEAQQSISANTVKNGFSSRFFQSEAVDSSPSSNSEYGLQMTPC